MRGRGLSCSLLLVLLMACRDDRPHVFQAPPALHAPIPQPARVASAPEVPAGTFADARIVSVSDAASGAPVALTDITRPIDVMTVCARGPTRPVRESARVELIMHGTTDAVQTLVLVSPAPSVVAHAFTIPAGDRTAGLRPGPYQMHVRIVGGDGRVLATSIPLYIELR